MSYELLTNIFSNLEVRGIDAAGCWGVDSLDDEGIIYHKEPGRSTNFVKTKFWNKIEKLNPNLLLLHARGASQGMGSPHINKNNHPFVSEDKRLGLVHNGVIYESEYLRKKYEVKSDCDSEILLRIFEAGCNQKLPTPVDLSEYVSKSISGIKDIWSYINRGHMAVALGERLMDGSKCLSLFRNNKRPLWIADLRSSLGQIFFFSSIEIWDKAIRQCKNSIISSSQKLIELPEKQIWFFRISEEDNIVTSDNFLKFNINVKPTYRSWVEGEYQKIRERIILDIPITTNLNEKEEVLQTTTRNVNYAMKFINEESVDDEVPFEMDTLDGLDNYYDLPDGVRNLEKFCNNIKDIVEDILINATNAAMEESITPSSFQEILNLMEQTKNDLDGTLQIVNNMC